MTAPTYFCHDTLNLYLSSDSFTFEPVYADPSHIRETLFIQRETGVWQLNAPPPPTIVQEEVLTVYGIVGAIKLNAGEYVVVITDRMKMGSIFGHDVYKLSGFKIIPIPRSRLHLSNQQLKDDETYLSMLNEMLSNGYLFFSYTYDLTNALQRQSQTTFKANWSTTDDRFFWNKHLQMRLIEHTTREQDQDLSKFILPIICGFLEIRPGVIRNKQFTFAIISRRSRYRAGTRYNMRGVDDDGNVANFVETEHLLDYPENKTKCSYVQTRGSMPLYWRQIPNIKYVPLLEITQHPSVSDSFRKHFSDQIHRYGNQIVVNLINKKGYEKRLGEEFLKQINLMNDVRVHYIHFDFHHHCRKMKYENIQLLINQMEAELNQQGYCQLNEADKIVRMQSSVVRTNCMDCLDRTNVVQSVLSRLFLNRQMVDLGLLNPNETFTGFTEFESTFKHVWADNADAISLQYSGTGALKTDYTRTGKRSTQGLLQDGKNSLVRYIKNNFMDGWRQDAYDLFVGRYQVGVHGNGVSPYLASQKSVVIFMPLFGIMLSLLATTFILSTERESLYPYGFSYIVFFLLIAFACTRLVLFFGHVYVDQPKLIPPAPPQHQVGSPKFTGFTKKVDDYDKEYKKL